jgi:hypothetical protein
LFEADKNAHLEISQALVKEEQQSKTKKRDVSTSLFFVN